jgi:hypothetical protein
VDLFLQFGRGHHGDGYLADDDALAGNTERHLLLPDGGITDDPPERLHHRPGIHDLPIHDGLWGKGRVAEPHQAVALAGLLELADFDRARPDVDPNQVLAFAHRASVPEVLARSDRLLHSG